MASKIVKYGLRWPEDSDALGIELAMIAADGYVESGGKQCGLGLFAHLMNARKLAWPQRYRHRWTDLLYTEFIKNDVTILMGSASSQKTSHAVEYCILNYWARPENTLVILSTVNMDKLDIGVWAELKMLWNSGRKNYPWLAGNLIEYKRAISTDNIEHGSRDFRSGIITRPCYIGGRFVGLGVLAGTKQDYIFYVSDELQFMSEGFSGTWPHLFSNGRVKIIGSGNPKHDPGDQLAITAEPVEGWSGRPEPEKTECWDTKFMGARCVNLVGTDSPNFDVPEGKPEPFRRLIGRSFARRIEHDYGKDSFEFYRLVKGVMKVAFAQSRIITRQLCRDHHALEKAVWTGGWRKRVYGLDPSYGGEDRCVGMALEFGTGLGEGQLIRILGYRAYHLNLMKVQEIEDQIAEILDGELNIYGIDPTDCFYDACGKGTLGSALGRKFGFRVPIAVDSGAIPTKRPVRGDLYVNVQDEFGNQVRRLKRCDEHYSKFVSEMWFSVRYTIEANQLRELTEEIMVEGCARIYNMAKGNRIEVEPKTDPKKKEDLKRRLGKSPDLFDTLAIGFEGARQRGFQISRLGVTAEEQEENDEWYTQEAKEYQAALKEQLLNHA